MNSASHGMSRAFPVGNPPPVFAAPVFTPQMPRTPGPGNQLNALTELTPAIKAKVDPRLTSQGTAPTRTIPNYVPYGVLDPRNVFLRPA